MPYLILIIGIIIGAFALFRFFVKASPAQIRKFFQITITVIYALILLFFALSGRIIISLALTLLAIPFIIAYFKGRITTKDSDDE